MFVLRNLCVHMPVVFVTCTGESAALSPSLDPLFYEKVGRGVLCGYGPRPLPHLHMGPLAGLQQCRLRPLVLGVPQCCLMQAERVLVDVIISVFLLAALAERPAGLLAVANLFVCSVMPLWASEQLRMLEPAGLSSVCDTYAERSASSAQTLGLETGSQLPAAPIMFQLKCMT